MDIKIAGYNVDSNLLKNSESTPETIAAAYARISRSSKTAEELRKDAIDDVAKARKSNEKIVYDYGHSSIAEHAVFNIDLVNLSRLASEYVQKHRLISFTEKSQRYCLLKDEFLFPKEIENSSFCFKSKLLIEQQFEAYHKIYNILLSNGLSEQEAKEDARYVLPLCAVSQMGMTVNARNLEHLISSLLVENIEELNEIAHKLYTSCHQIAPSLIKYVTPTEYKINNEQNAINTISRILNNYKIDQTKSIVNELVWCTEDPNNALIIMSLLLKYGFCSTAHQAWEIFQNLSSLEKENIIYSLFKDIGKHDTVPKELELIDVIFSLNISSSCYAQLKRHRLTTQLAGRYTTDYVLPPSIEKFAKHEFEEIMSKANLLYNELKNELPQNICEYILTNAHVRKIVFKTNLRELYHIANLRLDEHAQWEIRSLVKQVVTITKNIFQLESYKLCKEDV